MLRSKSFLGWGARCLCPVIAVSGWLYLARPRGGPQQGLELFNAAKATTSGVLVADDPLVDQIRRNPLGYIERIRGDYGRRVRDYTCRLTRQEFLGSRLGDEQVAEIKFREGPYSVFMHMIENPGQARRVLYVKDRFVENGQQNAVIEPESPIARLFVSSVRRPIDGEDAKLASRKRIDEFGFANALDLLIKYAKQSAEIGRLDLTFTGTGEIDHRPTYIFKRRLPIHEDPTRWPDALLVVHIDQEWELPVACFSYADTGGRDLLGKYVYTDVNLNVGLQAVDFDPQSYGM